MNHDYYEDDMVGAMITYLGDNGLFNDTVFIFQNDHGMDEKGTLYQGGSRIMNFVRYPPVFGVDGPMIMDSDFITSNIDVAATIFELANISLPDEYVLDGVSYWNDALAMLTDPDTANVTCCDYRIVDVYNSHSIVSGQYQYIYRATNQTEDDDLDDTFPSAFDDEQLYDLSVDPDQLVNLMNDTSYWRVVAVFQEIMRIYREDVCPADDPADCLRPDLMYVNYSTTEQPSESTTLDDGVTTAQDAEITTAEGDMDITAMEVTETRNISDASTNDIWFCITFLSAIWGIIY